ncbi:putative cyclic AMP-responsive element-binding protein 3-like protein 3 [Amylocarpus encephaloides]|uniref:Cyclic AMP-responsive element-binding protein 3-like protein 3 n=1 Tax=Amylocarpus encephaloides TaxID=45428 RepID=A0A9P8C629_9HELO|nr:putative cyclic AMP-responsive element-binding protein 3-like protein 3 [Amylocarpus encephaloides]
MSTSSQSPMDVKSTTSATQSGCLDPLDSLVDFSEYEQVPYHPSAASSPSATKNQFTTRAVSHTPPTLPQSQPVLSGPSHAYDMYRQQTGIPPGSVANTLAINQSNEHINSQYAFSDSYLSGLGPSDDFVDFNTAPRGGMDMDFESPSEPTFFYPDRPTAEFIDPSAIGSSSNNLPATAVLPTQTSNVGRLWPGMHQQQALAKAQAQQKQQQQLIQQQRQSAGMGHSRQPSSQRTRGSNPPSDPIVEEKISQLLNSMRQSSVGSEDMGNDADHMSQGNRMRKDEEEMDEDERLLASEEGKKLSSKERRQLRNKVSARAFRSRRKEYISQLEGEIATKVNENQDLRSQNRSLMEENTRLSDLTRMLLSSPSFSGFLDTLSQNPAAAQTAQQVTQPRVEQAQPQRQVRKDVNPYAAQQQVQQHVGMTLIPEHNMDFSMLDLNTDGGYSYQPQVFSVLSLPEPVIDTEMLSGKPSSFSPIASDDEKVELPKVERVPEAVAVEEPIKTVEVVDEEFDADPTFALFASSPDSAPAAATEEKEFFFDIASIDVFSKPSQYELVAAPIDGSSDATVKKLERLSARMDLVVDRLQHLTMNF